MYDRSKAHYIVATGIVIRDRRFLITKRSPKEVMMPALWTVPGGKLELKDYINRHKDTPQCWYNVIEDVLKREIMEETGLHITNIRYLTSMTYLRPDGVPTMVLSFYVDHKHGEVKLSPELTDHAWVTLEQARQYKLIPGILDELEMIDSVMKGKQADEWKPTSSSSPF